MKRIIKKRGILQSRKKFNSWPDKGGIGNNVFVWRRLQEEKLIEEKKKKKRKNYITCHMIFTCKINGL